jgi:hypothetical protein
VRVKLTEDCAGSGPRSLASRSATVREGSDWTELPGLGAATLAQACVAVRAPITIRAETNNEPT